MKGTLYTHVYFFTLVFFLFKTETCFNNLWGFNVSLPSAGQSISLNYAIDLNCNLFDITVQNAYSFAKFFLFVNNIKYQCVERSRALSRLYYVHSKKGIPVYYLNIRILHPPACETFR